jgi:MFS family permease
MEPRVDRKAAMAFIILMGGVSLFADMTYEGARSITGPYLAILGASAAIVGLVAGLGELIGYGLRFLAGILTDRTGRYWGMTILGYGVNLFAVPLLALAGSWEVAMALIIMERTGKALRSPAKDAILSYATSNVGHGWGFGLHEAMDQTGAFMGPLIVALVLYLGGDYSASFAILLIPALMAMTVLLNAYRANPSPQEMDVTPRLGTKGIPKAFWAYLVGVALVAAGFADFPLIAFHFELTSVSGPGTIALLYALAMGADAISALVLGRLFDRAGLMTLTMATILASLFAPLVFLGSLNAAIIGMILWGIGMGAQESIMRAAVAQLACPERRGMAYGTFTLGFGVAWFLGSVTMGLLYDLDIMLVVAVSMILQLAGAVVFLHSRKGIDGICSA